MSCVPSKLQQNSFKFCLLTCLIIYSMLTALEQYCDNLYIEFGRGLYCNVTVSGESALTFAYPVNV